MMDNKENSEVTYVAMLTIHGNPNWRIYYTNYIKGSVGGSRGVTSKLFDDVALVDFHVKRSDDDLLQVDMKYKKHKSTRDARITVKVTCKHPEYSKEFTCSNDLTVQTIFKARPNVNFGNVHVYHMHLYIQAYKVPKPNKCEMLHNDQDFTDFCFVTNGWKVPVHRACMVAHSEVFKAMLHGAWKETADGEIKIKGDQVTLRTLIHLKDYMYLGKLPHNEVELQTLLLIADRFMIHNLRDLCIRKLASMVSAGNFLSLLQFATGNNFTNLTFTILLLTPEDVVRSAYNLEKNNLVVPAQE